MTEEIFIEEIAKEIERLEAEMEFIEIEYNNYIRERKYIDKSISEFKNIKQSQKIALLYDVEALKEKYKDKITKGVKARF